MLMLLWCHTKVECFSQYKFWRELNKYETCNLLFQFLSMLDPVLLAFFNYGMTYTSLEGVIMLHVYTIPQMI